MVSFDGSMDKKLVEREICEEKEQSVESRILANGFELWVILETTQISFEPTGYLLDQHAFF